MDGDLGVYGGRDSFCLFCAHVWSVWSGMTLIHHQHKLTCLYGLATRIAYRRCKKYVLCKEEGWKAEKEGRVRERSLLFKSIEINNVQTLHVLKRNLNNQNMPYFCIPRWAFWREKLAYPPHWAMERPLRPRNKASIQQRKRNNCVSNRYRSDFWYLSSPITIVETAVGNTSHSPQTCPSIRPSIVLFIDTCDS